MPRIRCRWLTLSLVVMAALATLGQAQDSKDKDKDDKDVKPISPGANRDLPLVHALNKTRQAYQSALEELRRHYIQVGDLTRARWAEDELMQYHRIAKQAFRMDLDAPPPSLKGQENIPEANKIFRQAKGFKDKGWGTEYIDNQRRAEILFQRLLTKYYNSDKISETAYQLGELYESKAFQQYARAAVYFERCYQWNPKTQSDARIRAARLYDRQLNDRGKAAEIYRLILNHETDEKRIDDAKRRLQELSTRR